MGDKVPEGLTVSSVRKGYALWVTVTGPLSLGKRASQKADRAARQWVRAAGYRRAYRRVTREGTAKGRFSYVVCYAFA